MGLALDPKKLGINLPPGFSLKDEEGEIRLERKGRIGRILFSKDIDPKEIERIAWRLYNKVK